VANAQVGTLTLWWDGCTPTGVPAAVGTKSWAGPGIYTQVVSAHGTEAVCLGWEATIQITPTRDPGVCPAQTNSSGGDIFPDAWRFDAHGCNQEQLSLSTLALNASCPRLQGAHPLPLFQYDFNTAVSGPNRGILQAFNSFDPFDPQASKDYTVFKLQYNHDYSNIGPQDPTIACGNAQIEMCFRMSRHGFLNASNQVVNWPLGTRRSQTLSPPVPTQPFTWGRISDLPLASAGAYRISTNSTSYGTAPTRIRSSTMLRVRSTTEMSLSRVDTT
jgi:hypothetical protein